MKIERISINKVKLTVFNEDLDRWGIASHSITPDSPEIHNVFVSLLKKAESEIGVKMFDSPGVMIEALRKPEGIIFFVTTPKVGSISINPQPRSEKLRTKSVLQRVPFGIYKFETIDDLCEYVKTLNSFSERSDLYHYEGAYYIIMEEETKRPAGLMDYASAVKKTGLSVSFLREHGKTVILSNALEVIHDTFCKD